MIAMANFLELQHGLIFREILLEGGIAYGQGGVRKVRVVHVILLESDIVCSLVLLPHAAVQRELLLEGGTAWDNFVHDTWCIDSGVGLRIWNLAAQCFKCRLSVI